MKFQQSILIVSLPILLLIMIYFTLAKLVTDTKAAGNIINVPGDAATVQGGINIANNGDTVLIAPGIYNENLILNGKTITLTSHFLTTNDPTFINNTIIDGGNGSQVIFVGDNVGPETTIYGLTIRNADDGLIVFSDINMYYCHISNTKDAIDYEGAGGINKYNLYDLNRDDGIDLDDPRTVLIEENIIINNQGDGIEIRLQDEEFTTTQKIVMRNNLIAKNAEDGIQFIDYFQLTNREFTAERNLIVGNAHAGIGLMDNAESTEDYRAASILERIQLFNNTIISHNHGLTGGDNLVAVNNIIANNTVLGVKNTDGGSMVSHTLFWNNNPDILASNVVTATAVFTDPLFSTNYHLQALSQAIDAGIATFDFGGETVLEIPVTDYAGAAPDIGAFENGLAYKHKMIVPVLNIAHGGGGTAELKWNTNPASCDYEVQRSTAPYAGYTIQATIPSMNTYNDMNTIGNPAENYFFVLSANCYLNSSTNNYLTVYDSNNVGEFDFAILPGI